MLGVSTAPVLADFAIFPEREYFGSFSWKHLLSFCLHGVFWLSLVSTGSKASFWPHQGQQTYKSTLWGHWICIEQACILLHALNICASYTNYKANVICIRCTIMFGIRVTKGRYIFTTHSYFFMGFPSIVNWIYESRNCSCAGRCRCVYTLMAQDMLPKTQVSFLPPLHSHCPQLYPPWPVNSLVLGYSCTSRASL